MRDEFRIPSSEFQILNSGCVAKSNNTAVIACASLVNPIVGKRKELFVHQLFRARDDFIARLVRRRQAID